VGDVSVLDKVAIVVLCAMMIIVGVYPAIMYPIVNAGVAPVLNLFGVN
jgi:NADH:ubiquinone oxidoreductase subunit 4 (subunit M)